LLVFGGADPISQFVVESALHFGFRREKNLGAWSKCGAAPITRCCFKNHSQVRRELGADYDATNCMIHLGVAKQNNNRKKNELMKKKELALRNNKIVQEALVG
jgi:hypothetical protein